MGCQTAIAERILARGADYLLTLKANHPLAYQAVAPVLLAQIQPDPFHRIKLR